MMVEIPTSEIISQRLRQQREARHVSLEQAAAALHINLRYVQAMDKGEFDIFPSPVQARGFLRSYVQYLNLEAEPYLAALDGDASLLEEDQESLDEPASGEYLGDFESQEAIILPGGEAEPGLEMETAAGGDQVAGGDQAAGGGQATSSQGMDEGRGDSTDGQRAAAGTDATGSARKPPRTASRYPRTKFEEIGLALRRQRETLGLSLDDIEHHTRLRAYYLKALESGDLDSLPSPVQGRGMLKNYASFLGMDVDALLMQFAEGLQARLEARGGLRILKRSGRAALYTPMGSPRPRLITTDVLLAGVLIVFLFAFIAWGVIRISGMRAGQAPTATAPGISDVLAQVGTPTYVGPAAGSSQLSATALLSTQELQEAALAGETETPTATPPPEFSSASVQVIITVHLRTWMRVTVDGKVEFEGRVQAGSAFPFAGDKRVEILTGNGAGLEVNLNQINMGILGTFGEAVQRVFTVQGMQTPTPTITRTPAPATITPTLTPTQGQ